MIAIKEDVIEEMIEFSRSGFGSTVSMEIGGFWAKKLSKSRCVGGKGGLLFASETDDLDNITIYEVSFPDREMIKLKTEKERKND